MNSDRMDEAELWVRKMALRFPKRELIRSFIECLIAGAPFTPDDVTHFGELTVTGDTRLDGPQTKITLLFNTARTKGWIVTLEEGTSDAPRRRTSINHTHGVTAEGKAMAPFMLTALDRYEALMNEDV